MNCNFYYFFALAGFVLSVIALGILLYYTRQIEKKNRSLTRQIMELIKQQKLLDDELQEKISSVPTEDKEDKKEEIQDGFCPETRKDKLCVAIHDILVKDKAYRNPVLTRDYVIERLGTNKELFVDAFYSCFRTTFSDYINILRLKDATTLLEKSDLSIEAISEKIGFGTIRTFQRQFQAKYSMTPKDFRKSVKKPDAN